MAEEQQEETALASTPTQTGDQPEHCTELGWGSLTQTHGPRPGQAGDTLGPFSRLNEMAPLSRQH